MNKKSLYITLAVVIGCLAIGFTAGYYYVDTETQKIISSREEIIKEKDNFRFFSITDFRKIFVKLG